MKCHLRDVSGNGLPNRQSWTRDDCGPKSDDVVDQDGWPGPYINLPLPSISRNLLASKKNCYLLLSLLHSFLLGPWFLNMQYFSSVQSLSCVQLFATPWTAAHQASLSITNSRSFLKLMSIESVMLSNHFILCCPFLLLPSIFPTIRVFFNELILHIRWPKYWGFSFNINPFNEYSGLISFKID